MVKYESYAALLVAVYNLPSNQKEQIAGLMSLEHSIAIDEAIEDLQFYKKEACERRTTTIRRYYGLGCEKATLKTIGQEFTSPVNPERVRQIRTRSERLLIGSYKLRPVIEVLVASGFESVHFKFTLRLPTQEQINMLHQRIKSGDGSWKTVSIEVLGLSVRSSMCLIDEGVLTLGELVLKKRSELFRLPHFGRKSMIDVEEKLATLGLKLAT